MSRASNCGHASAGACPAHRKCGRHHTSGAVLACRGVSEMDWHLEPSAADEEIPSTPPDEQTDRHETASALPGVIPTQWAAGR